MFGGYLTALRRRLRSAEALYYKEGDFLEDGSLLHFELSQLADPDAGLLEWATPECRGPVEAACVLRAQEELLRAASDDVARELAAAGHEGRAFLLKNNRDRAGNAYGCHESYDARERPAGPRRLLFAWILHPLVVSLCVTTAVAALSVPVVVLAAGAVLYAALAVLGELPLLGALPRALGRALVGVASYLGEPGPGPGQGAAARAFLLLLRGLAALFSLTAREVILAGHVPALVPFLVTRPLLCGAGHLTPDGRYELSPRAAITDRVAAAFIYGRTRPLIELKEFFFQQLLRWGAARKRLQLVCGDANRAEPAALLKLGTTCAVLEAIEAGALDELAARLELLGGPLAAFRAACADPSARAPVARDRATGALLSAHDVQRRYLEAVWAHARARPDWPSELTGALRRWDDALRRLREEPATLARDLDWAIKLDLLQATLQDALPNRPLDAAWRALQAWGPINALLERHAPSAPFPPGEPAPAVAARLRAALGRGRYAQAARAARAANLDWAELPAVRAAWLRMAAADLGYHELSARGGAFEALEAEGRIARALDPAAVARARQQAPHTTRARLRGLAVARRGALGERRGGVKVGWTRVELGGAEERATFALDDPDRHEHPELEAALAAEIEEVATVVSEDEQREDAG